MWPFNKLARANPAAAGSKPANQSPKIVGLRNYSAGVVNRLTASWTATPLTIDEVVRRNLRTLRARSREQYENNDYAKRFVMMAKNHVIGPNGIKLQAKIRDTSGTMDKLANDAVEAAWNDWSRREFADIEQRLGFIEQQRLFVATVATDGEAIARIIYGKQAGKYRFALQNIDPELLDINHNADLSSGNVIRFGIEFNALGRRVAYHFRDVKANSFYGTVGNQYIRVPADEIIHEFIPERVGQKRGFPWCSTALARMNMLNGYEEASLVNARAGASKMGFYTTTGATQYAGDDTDADGNLLEEVEPGMMTRLPQGVEFSPYDPTYPNGEFSNFVKQSLRGISAGLGVSYNTLANDLEGVNFSSMRHGAIEEREIWQVIQQWMIDGYCRPIFEKWLTVQLLAGTITIAGSPLKFEREEKYRQVGWQPRRWRWIDPMKDVQANILAVNNGFRSRSDIIRDLGDDPEDVWAEIEQENKMLKDKNITLQVDKELKGGEPKDANNDSQD